MYNESCRFIRVNIAEIFSQSMEKHKLRYSRFIGDGDTNTFKVVSE